MASGATQAAVLIVGQTIFLISFVTCYASVFALINNSAPKHARGAINGMAQTAVGLTRTIAPWAAGNIYAWSVSEDSPFSFHLCFVVGSVGFLLCFVTSLGLDERINTQKT